MELKQMEKHVVSCKSATTIVYCGWRERGKERDYLMMDRTCDNELLTCRNGGSNIRSGCEQKFTSADVKEMKRILQRYIKDIKQKERQTAV